ncbi:MAG: hypothetical protein K5744_06060 [Eubacterium sp.]|nr:hypothetical protein [Eubacterium sp.]
MKNEGKSLRRIDPAGVFVKRENPFEVSVDPFYSSANQSVLEESIQQLKVGKCKKHDMTKCTPQICCRDEFPRIGYTSTALLLKGNNV